MKKTILGGVLFLAPLAVVLVLLGKVFQISRAVVTPVDHLLPIQVFLGIASVNLLAIVLIVLICYIAGALAQRVLVAQRLQRLDGFLIDVLPAYAVFKGVIGSASADETLSTLLTPVMVRFDDYEQLAFEIEADDARSVVFLPGSPSAWSGSTVIVDNERVTYLDLATIDASRLLRTFGRGSLKARVQLKKVESQSIDGINPATP